MARNEMTRSGISRSFHTNSLGGLSYLVFFFVPTLGFFLEAVVVHII